MDLDHPDAPESLEILGNFNTEKASNLMIVFERCDITKENNNCASDEDFKKWTEQKYIFSLINEKKFVKNKFQEFSLAAFATTNWLGISTNSRNDVPKIITRSHIKRSDEPFDIAEMQSVQDNGFFLETMSLRALPYANMFHNTITFELSLSEMQYRRHVYSILDFVGDIGGLYGALFPICTILVIIL